jgi:hypothetical protein
MNPRRAIVLLALACAAWGAPIKSRSAAFVRLVTKPDGRAPAERRVGSLNPTHWITMRAALAIDALSAFPPLCTR